MKKFDRLKQILDNAIQGQVIGAHGPFWRPLSLDQFKVRSVFGKRLVVPGDVTNSNLALALRGQLPFGSDTGTPNADFPRMPAGLPPVPDDQIAFIEQWIRDGCPDEEWQQPLS